LRAAYQEIQVLCDAKHLTQQVANTVKHLFKMTQQTKALKGKSQASIIASCIFITCRQSNNLRTFKEITTLTNVPKKEIGRTFKLLEKFLQRHAADPVVIVSGGAAFTQEKYNIDPQWVELLTEPVSAPHWHNQTKLAIRARPG